MLTKLLNLFKPKPFPDLEAQASKWRKEQAKKRCKLKIEYIKFKTTFPSK